MQYVTFKSHAAVGMYRLGYSPIGRPLLSVYCYLLDDLLIDTAQRNCETKLLQTFKNKDINRILLTHWHEDHAGNVESLANAHGAQVIAPAASVPFLEKGFKGLVYERFLFGSLKAVNSKIEVVGQKIITANHRLLPLFTPGHSVDHTVYLEPDKGWLFAGDLFVGVQIAYFRRGEAFWQQVESFKKVMAYDFDVIFCGHHPRLSEGKNWLKRKINYFENFGGQVRELHKQGYSVSEIMQKMQLRENHLVRILTSNDVSLEYMIEAATKSS